MEAVSTASKIGIGQTSNSLFRRTHHHIGGVHRDISQFPRVVYHYATPWTTMLKKLLKPLAHQCAANINQEVWAECLIVANSHQSIVDVARLTTIDRQLLTQHNHFLAQFHH